MLCNKLLLLVGIQASDGGLVQSGGSGDGEERVVSKEIYKIESTGGISW